MVVYSSCRTAAETMEVRKAPRTATKRRLRNTNPLLSSKVSAGAGILCFLCRCLALPLAALLPPMNQSPCHNWGEGQRTLDIINLNNKFGSYAYFALVLLPTTTQQEQCIVMLPSLISSFTTSCTSTSGPIKPKCTNKINSFRFMREPHQESTEGRERLTYACVCACVCTCLCTWFRSTAHGVLMGRVLEKPIFCNY